MSIPSTAEIVASGFAYTVVDSGLCCARCYLSHGLVCTLTYRYAPTWSMSGRRDPRWVETFACPFCRNEINEVELRLPIRLLPSLVETGGRFYDRLTGESFPAPPEAPAPAPEEPAPPSNPPQDSTSP